MSRDLPYMLDWTKAVQHASLGPRCTPKSGCAARKPVGSGFRAAFGFGRAGAARGAETAAESTGGGDVDSWPWGRVVSMEADDDNIDAAVFGVENDGLDESVRETACKASANPEGSD